MGLRSNRLLSSASRVFESSANLPARSRLVVIGPQFDIATYSIREFLQRNSIEFDWFTPGDAAAPQEFASVEPGEYPAVRLRDGALLKNPSIRDIAKANDLCVTPQRAIYDVAIVGGGPAGLAAAVYGASEGLSTILLESEAPGGQAGTSSRIENYLGFPYGISGGELAMRALQQAKRLGAEIVVTRTVENLDAVTRVLELDGADIVRARSIVIATGVSWRRSIFRHSTAYATAASTTAPPPAKRDTFRARTSIWSAAETQRDKRL